MQTLTVSLAERSYPIHIGPGLLERGDLIAPHFKQKKALVVTNTTVAPLYLERLAATLAAIGIEVASVVLPDGEQYKTWETLNTIFDALLAGRSERGTTLVLVTHNVFQAKRLAHRVGLLWDGQLVELAPTRAFFESPNAPQVAAFLRGELVY